MVGKADVGQHRTLARKLARTLASAAILGTLAFAGWSFSGTPSLAAGDTRTISLYVIQNKERLTVTYMVNGRYVPSAMKKINYLLRDWRRNEVITIDPKLVDLVWELHADLGSKAPIGIVSGYRSPKTNAFLKRIGRNVAGKSQHINGKAIDFFFSDVPTKKIRNVALARSRLGGVGYYSSAGGPTGFIHADSGKVRQWGPGMGGSQVASYIRDGKKYVGKRSSGNLWSSTQVASAEPAEKKSGGLLGLLMGGKKTAQEGPALAEAQVDEVTATPLEAAYEGAGDELADLSADAAEVQSASDKKKLKLRAPTPVDTAEGMADAEAVASGELAALADSAAAEAGIEDGQNSRKLPRPRLKPSTVLAMANAKEQELSGGIHISPASAPPETQALVRKPSQVAALGSLNAAGSSLEGPLEDASEEALQEGFANPEGKSSLSGDDVIIRPIVAALGSAESSWWSLLAPEVEADIRLNGLPPGAEDMKAGFLPVAVELGPDGTGPATSMDVESEMDGKGDLVNYEGKGNLPEMVLRTSSLAGSADDTSALE